MEAKRILVIEDDPKVVIFLVDQLEAMGFDVIVTRDGEAGLSAARAELPDLIILDIMMPKMDGYEVCQYLKRGDATRNLPILMLSARGQKREIVEGLDTGADDYLTKPYDGGEFEARVRALLRRAPAATDPTKDTSEISDKKAEDSPDPDTAELLDRMCLAFNEEELRELSFRLRVDFDDLRGAGKKARARELIEYLQRRDRLTELIDACRELRPKRSW